MSFPTQLKRLRTILAVCLLFLPATWGQRRVHALGTTATNTTNFTFSTVTVYSNTNVDLSQQVNTFQVELKARMQGGAVLFDQTYNAALTDPTVQAAIAQAENVLTNAGAASFIGPTQLSSTQTLASSDTTTTTVVTATNVSTVVSEYVGPQTLMVGTNQSQAFTLLPLLFCPAR
jgi:hypothetical protein